MEKIKKYKNIEEAIDSQEFYELMQIYRHTKITDLTGVYNSFENVKNFIKQNK